jgi:hypothetical protein
MFLMLLVFATSLAVVLSCYRDDEPAEVLRGTLRRAVTFTGAVLVFAVLAWLVSSTVLYPG